MQNNGITPRTKEEAKRYNKFSYNWDWIHIRHWPSDITEAVIKGKLGYQTIFRWFVYLIGNGMDPRKARNIIKGEVSHFREKEQVDNLYKSIKYKAKYWTYWDESQGKIMNLEDSIVFEDLIGDNIRYPKELNNNKKYFSNPTVKPPGELNTAFLKKWNSDARDDGYAHEDLTDFEDF